MKNSFDPNFDAGEMCQKCYVFAYTFDPLHNKRANVILTLTPPLTHVKGGIKYLMGLLCI